MLSSSDPEGGALHRTVMKERGLRIEIGLAILLEIAPNMAAPLKDVVKSSSSCKPACLASTGSLHPFSPNSVIAMVACPDMAWCTWEL